MESERGCEGEDVNKTCADRLDQAKMRSAKPSVVFCIPWDILKKRKKTDLEQAPYKGGSEALHRRLRVHFFPGKKRLGPRFSDSTGRKNLV